MPSDMVLSHVRELWGKCLSHPLSFALVYDEKPIDAWLQAINGAVAGAIIYEVDLTHQRADIRDSLVTTNWIECRAHGFVEGVPRPVPYMSAYVRGMGPIDTAYSLAEISSVILRAKQEQAEVERFYKSIS